MAKLNIPTGIAKAIAEGKTVIWAQKSAYDYKKGTFKILPRINNQPAKYYQIEALIRNLHLMSWDKAYEFYLGSKLMGKVPAEDLYIDIVIMQDYYKGGERYEHVCKANFFSGDTTNKMEIYEKFCTGNERNYGFTAAAPEPVEITAEAMATPKTQDAAIESEIENATAAIEEPTAVKEETKIKKKRFGGIETTVNSAEAAIAIIQTIAPASYKEENTALLDSKADDRVIHYNSTDSKITYCEAYENGAIDHINLFNIHGDYAVTLQISANGAGSLTAEEIAEICAALKIEAPTANTESETKTEPATGGEAIKVYANIYSNDYHLTNDAYNYLEETLGEGAILWDEKVDGYDYRLSFEEIILEETYNQIRTEIKKLDDYGGFKHSIHGEYETEKVYDDDEDGYEPCEPEPEQLTIDSDGVIATLGGLLITTLTALYNVTTKTPEPVNDSTPAKIEEQSVERVRYIVRLYGYDAAFPSDPLYSKGTYKFDTLSDAVKYALNDRNTRSYSEHFGGSDIDKDFTSCNTTGLMTVMTIARTGEIKVFAPESRQILEKLADTDKETSAVKLKISNAPVRDNLTFAIHQPPLDVKSTGSSLDSETPATETTIFFPPRDTKTIAKYLFGAVLDLKESADEIEELLAGGYTLGDSGDAAIAKALEHMKQARAELDKLKFINSAA